MSESNEQSIERRCCLAPWQVALLLVLPLLVHLFCAFHMSGGIDLLKSPNNAFFDMDTVRVITDWTSWEKSDRSRTHPLYKYLALPGMLIHRVVFGGENPVDTARVMCLVGVLLNGLLTGILVAKLAQSRTAGLLAGFIAAFSFASLLLVAIPDTAAVSCLLSLAPMIVYYFRDGKPMPAWEIILWVFLLLAGFGVTISQLAPVAIALGFRLRAAGCPPASGETKAGGALLARRLLFILIPFVILVAILLRVQSKAFDNTERHYRLDKIIKKEIKFVESEQLKANPFKRFADEVLHMALYTFVPPPPMIEQWSPPRDEDRKFVSITFVAKERAATPWHHLVFRALQAALLILCLWKCRPTRRMLPIALALGLQVALHFVYGREFMIYALNWHSLLIVLLFASAPATAWRQKGLAGLLWGFCVVMLAFNLWTMWTIYHIYRHDYPIQTARQLMEQNEKNDK